MTFHAVYVVLKVKSNGLTALNAFKDSHIHPKMGAEAPNFYANERTTTKRSVAEAKLTSAPVSFWKRILTVLAALT